jgi:hypothetical protein
MDDYEKEVKEVSKEIEDDFQETEEYYQDTENFFNREHKWGWLVWGVFTISLGSIIIFWNPYWMFLMLGIILLISGILSIILKEARYLGEL